MSAQSFCKSKGMDLVALESEHEADYFMKSCEKASLSFEELTHIGGVSDEGLDNWYWISSNGKVTINLKLQKDKQNKTERNCMQLVKSSKGFSYGRTNCFSSELKKFICQEIILNKLDSDSSILGI